MTIGTGVHQAKLFRQTKIQFGADLFPNDCLAGSESMTGIQGSITGLNGSCVKIKVNEQQQQEINYMQEITDKNIQDIDKENIVVFVEENILKAIFLGNNPQDLDSQKTQIEPKNQAAEIGTEAIELHETNIENLNIDADQTCVILKELFPAKVPVLS